MTSTDVKEALQMKRNMQKLGIDREMLFDALDGILSESELYNFLDGKGNLPVGARSVIWCVLENIESVRVTRNDPSLVMSRKGRIIQKSRPESEFLLGKRYLQSV